MRTRSTPCWVSSKRPCLQANPYGTSIAGKRNSSTRSGHVFSPGSELAPDDYLVVARNPSAFRDAYGSDIEVAPEGYANANLSNGGETVVLKSAAGVEIDTCTACGSFWFDKGELRALTHRVADIQTVEGAVSSSRFTCPVCHVEMKQHRFLSHHDLLVDKCPSGHGFYLERNELARTLEM